MSWCSFIFIFFPFHFGVWWSDDVHNLIDFFLFVYDHKILACLCRYVWIFKLQRYFKLSIIIFNVWLYHLLMIESIFNKDPIKTHCYFCVNLLYSYYIICTFGIFISKASISSLLCLVYFGTDKFCFNTLKIILILISLWMYTLSSGSISTRRPKFKTLLWKDNQIDLWIMIETG